MCIDEQFAAMAASEILPKVIALLDRRGFVRKRLIQFDKCQKRNLPALCYSFGPAGTIVKRNIEQAWWENMVIRRKDTFPVESGVSAQQHHTMSGLVEEHFLSVADLVGRKLPFSIAQVEKTDSNSTTEGTASDSISKEGEQRFLFDGDLQTSLSFQHFCDPVKTPRALDTLLMSRLHWWQQYASHPQNFSVTDIEKNSNGNSTACIQYKFPWGLDTLETISNLQDHPFRVVQKENLHKYKCENSNQSVLPSVLSCKVTLERGFLAYMLDAYTELKAFTVSKQHRSSDSKVQVQLHPYLAPYKMSVVLNGSRARDLKVLADNFSVDLRQSGITILNIYDHDMPVDQQFARNDELGIPYTVVVEDKSLQTGIVHIRSRDTTLKSGTHVTKLKDFLQKHIENSNVK